jgi:hypothetical protein
MIAAFLILALAVGYAIGRARPMRSARDWAEDFIRFHDGTGRFFGVRAVVALILSADAVYYSTFLPWLRNRRGRG